MIPVPLVATSTMAKAVYAWSVTNIHCFGQARMSICVETVGRQDHAGVGAESVIVGLESGMLR